MLVVIAAFFVCWSPHQLLMAHAIFATESPVSILECSKYNNHVSAAGLVAVQYVLDRHVRLQPRNDKPHDLHGF